LIREQNQDNHAGRYRSRSAAKRLQGRKIFPHAEEDAAFAVRSCRYTKASTSLRPDRVPGNRFIDIQLAQYLNKSRIVRDGDIMLPRQFDDLFGNIPRLWQQDVAPVLSGVVFQHRASLCSNSFSSYGSPDGSPPGRRKKPSGVRQRD